ncbi:unnamed protein product [Medioppia subpectinata]|uniref:Sodium-dependent glucose transporter 1 n=1 Tax=Medioppia subpectinata TaxID=1979941 RepID=A0A7R9LB43_9ACAR|nr:unnamed protein product [Medioppia subpectinata]CAG2117425.1 unnamed protein product [Medioppia subpectinata]
MQGLTASMPGTAYVDFTHTANTSLPMIGLMPSFSAGGTFCGSFATLIFKWVNRQIYLSLAVLAMGLSTIFLPYCTEVWQLWLCTFIYGLGTGAWNGCNNVVLVEMWTNLSSSMLLFSQFLWGVGTIIGPLMTANYVIGNDVCPGVLPEECLSVNTSAGTTELLPTLECSEQCLTYNRQPALEIPFIIGGVLELIGPVLYFAMYFIKKYHYINDLSEPTESNKADAERRAKLVPKYTILTCISIVFLFAMCSENLFAAFAPTFFQYQPVLRIPASEASLMNSAMNGAFAFGRLISVFIAYYVTPPYMIIVQLFITLGGYIFLIVGQNIYACLWASSIIIAFGFSTIWICLFSFVGRYTPLTNVIGGYFATDFIENDPNVYLYLSLGGVVIVK